MKVVYTDPTWAITESGLPSLARADIETARLGEGIQLLFGPHDGTSYVTSGPDLVNAVRGVDAVVIYRIEVTTELIDALRPTCRVVGRQGDGIDNLNADGLKAAGIWAFNIPDYCVEEAATHAIGLMLSWERRITRQDRRVKSGGWAIRKDGVPRRLSSCRLGLVGFGRVARAVSAKAGPFFGAVAAYDPAVHADQMAAFGAQAMSLEEMLAASDIVSVHASLNSSSQDLINASALASIRRTALLVNTARGRLVDSRAVLDALDGGRLAGYCADVFAPEDPRDDVTNKILASRSDVIVTCHSGFLSNEADISVRRRTADEIAWVLRNGRPPRQSRQA